MLQEAVDKVDNHLSQKRAKIDSQNSSLSHSSRSTRKLKLTDTEGFEIIPHNR